MTIADDEGAFVQALGRLETLSGLPERPRDSLLPLSYEASAIVGRFEKILADLLLER